MRVLAMLAGATVLTSMLGCAHVTPPPSVPSRVDVKWAVDSAWAGLELLGHECARQVRLGTSLGDFDAAIKLGQACVAIDDPAEADRRRLIRALQSWDAARSPSQIGCAASDLVNAYEEFLSVLDERGRGYSETPAIEYGRSSARWLSSLNRTGRCTGDT